MTTFGQIMEIATVKTEEVKVVDQAKIDRYIQALAAGKAWAKSLKVGEPFIGCAPAAEAAGYDRNSHEGRLFISEAFDGLRGLTVYTDRETGVITRIADRFGAEDAIAKGSESGVGWEGGAVMLSPALVVQAAKAGSNWGLGYADHCQTENRWPDWIDGQYWGWVPDGAQRTAYNDLVDRAAKTMYEMVRDAAKSDQEVR